MTRRNAWLCAARMVVVALSAIGFANTVGSDGALWFANHGPSSFGRITVGGTVTTGDIDHLSLTTLTTGPDGARWFSTSSGDPLGRRSAAGTVSTDGGSSTAIAGPAAITSGPDGALWFTNETNSTIGRISIDGSGSNFQDKIINEPRRSRRARTARCGSRTWAATPSVASPPQEWCRASTPGVSLFLGGSRRARTGPCGSPTSSSARSVGSQPRA